MTATEARKIIIGGDGYARALGSALYFDKARKPSAYHDPDDVADFEIDWSRWLGADTISTQTSKSDGGVTVDSSSISGTSTLLQVSGDAGEFSEVTVFVTSAASLKRTLVIRFYGREQ